MPVRFPSGWLTARSPTSLTSSAVRFSIPDNPGPPGRALCADSFALSVSSPFWSDGSDTGYASVRTLVWQRWPTTGLCAPVTTAAASDKLVADQIATGVIADAGMVYFDVRPGVATPTVELRVCDSCPSLDTVVLIAALFRALVDRELDGLRASLPGIDLATPLGRAALWRAARSGLEGDLVDIGGPAARLAHKVVTDLVHLLEPQLKACDDLYTVADLAAQTLAEGFLSVSLTPSAAPSRQADRRRRRTHRRHRPLTTATAPRHELSAAMAITRDVALLVIEGCVAG